MGTMYAPEFRHKALRMLAEARPDHVSEWAAITHVAGLLGINRDTLRKWRRRQQIDQGQRAGVSSEAAAEVKRLTRENAELRRANEILKAASVFFAKELDHPQAK